MLLELSVRNFALVDEVDLRFGPGLTVFTGETGAGKSLLVDAFGLLLGDRASASWVGRRADEAVLSGVFRWGTREDDPTRSALERLVELGLARSVEEDIVVRRHLSRDGRHRVFVNDRPATAQVLQEVFAPTIELVGQHASLVLLRPHAVSDLLDAAGDHRAPLAAMSAAWTRHKEASSRLKALHDEARGRQEREAFLRFQINELETLGLRAGEFEALEVELEAVRAGARIEEGVRQALGQLAPGGADVGARLSAAATRLTALADFASDLSALGERLEALSVEVDDAIAELSRYRVKGPGLAELDALEGRHETLRRAFRRHHGEEQELLERLARCRDELSTLEEIDDLLRDAEVAARERESELHAAAMRLHEARVATAGQLFEQVRTALSGLGMAQARLELGDHETSARPGPLGWRELPLLFSANRGETLMPLGKVASGGELSRLVLALKSVSADVTGVQTCIFDEVDTGIGGGTGEIVGRLLAGMAEGRQVFCVTHLAQIACFADAHFHVTKIAEGEGTVSRWQSLSPPERATEIARMLSGVDLTEASLENARTLLRNAGKHVDA